MQAMPAESASPFSAGTADIEAIERNTLDAVAPQSVAVLEGWLLPFDDSSIGRARSAVPLRHDQADPAVLPAIEAAYTERALPVSLRLPDVPGFVAFRQLLRERGYQAGRPTHVQVAELSALPPVDAARRAALEPSPDQAWAALFLGEGFDPVDGAMRVRNLRRARGTLFASMRQGGATVAAGAGAFSHGWVSAHGMRTELAQRGRGHASCILATLADEARRRGLTRMFLQVEQGNHGALSLYARLGFRTAWSYDYWSRHG